MNRKRILNILASTVVILASFLTTSTVYSIGSTLWYVSQGGEGDCTSWEKACDLQTALTHPNLAAGDQVWVAQGTYLPTAGAFTLRNGVDVYGGFAGTEPEGFDVNQRDWESHPTILSGDLANNDPILDDNTPHVVIANYLNWPTVLDGFTLSGGSSTTSSGGGLFAYIANLTIRNIKFEDNHAYTGGGLYFEGSLSATLTNVSFINNTAVEFGGAILNYGTLTVNEAVFSNDTSDYGGGAIWNFGTLTVNESTFDNNLAAYAGGIYNAYAGVVYINNSTLFANRSTDNSACGGGIINNGPLTLRNSTLSNNGKTICNFLDGTLNFTNTIVANSIGQDCYNIGVIGTNTNNLVEDGSCFPAISGDPKLGPLADNGGPTQTMSILPDSPAYNAGDDLSCLATDQRGIGRPQGAHCDIGAYEMAAPTASTGPASAITLDGATLNGTVNAGDASATVSFEYGLTNGYGTTVPGVPSPVGVGVENTQVSALLSGLKLGTQYHYRVVATNVVDTVYGADQTFTTGDLLKHFLPVIVR